MMRRGTFWRALAISTLAMLAVSPAPAQTIRPAGNPNVSTATGTLPVANGGTGSTSASSARTALGVTTVGSATVGQIPGVTDNTAATAGNIGQYISSEILQASAVSNAAGTGNPVDVTSVSLTAGHWQCTGSAGGLPTTSSSAIRGWISTTSATAPTITNSGANTLMPYAGGASIVEVPVGTLNLNLSGTTTVYLSERLDFVGTATKFGFIGCTRVQ